ncbi:hypothetical protein SYNPS1DRAFT_28322 [Syncephalis pseudoplumigaleata]|uniref:Uncharacterized protein n=1 Tax=Syncephalis pseudoplumigaleata TaxID=1712513 RepID=A0A4P9Z383_9FUNG|nr:hypothetical protein SYNPS1DRAFT_28322 [Syncephalis pseudoplumigaleata]|eukprot:RKP25960.1 hypothetical protein SYNPS1DRAFT_28322 [Syncephalis pseudoplumigaleata]
MTGISAENAAGICFPTIDIYDCVFDQRLNYAIMACLAVSCLNSAVAGFIASYRWSRGLLTVLFRRVDGYWLPKPVDTLLIGLWIMNSVRAVMYACTLFNWPEYRLVRTIINILGTILMPLVSTFFVVGIIAHIPAIFAQSTYRHRESALPSAVIREWAAHWKQYSIRLPSTTFLYWAAVTICLQMFMLHLAIGIWLNWAYEHKYTSMIRIANPIMFISMTVSTLMILAASIYYCYGFYRIMYVHVHRPDDEHPANSAEKQSAHRFRNIFLAIIIIYTTACVHTVVKGICNELFLQKPWLHMLFMLIPHALVYPAFEMIIFVNVLQSSRAQVRRDTYAGTADDHAVGLPMEQVRPNYSYRTSQSKRATASTLNHTGYDPSLVWHSLTSIPPQHTADTESQGKPECIEEMELIAGHVSPSPSSPSEKSDTFVEAAVAPCDSPVMGAGLSRPSYETSAYDVLCNEARTKQQQSNSDGDGKGHAALYSISPNEFGEVNHSLLQVSPRRCAT